MINLTSLPPFSVLLIDGRIQLEIVVITNSLPMND